MPAPVALQLYTLRESLAKNFEAGVRKVAELGYVGVETAGFPGTTPAAAAKLFKELGLEVCSAHVGLPVGPKKQEVLDTMNTIGSKRIVTGFGPDQYKTTDLIKASCAKFNEAAAVARENGMTLGIHNHWWEFQQVEGRHVYKVMLENLDPGVFFEVDTYWVQTGGCDPAAVVKELGKRAPLLHIKDGPCVKELPMTAVGEGKVNFPAVVKAAGANAQWMIVELDRCATDMMDAVVKSYGYLVKNGLARGKKG
ncbi:MAG: sugar phosphate isomerase/epimerase [Planctomycetes bacterium]|nr:sugar phosphate isomerase/epimerase [Planctomycetota bacterium]MBM4083656.1 sugar phosphate isomerase/epimerase [Planctomycetota bacterium]